MVQFASLGLDSFEEFADFLQESSNVFSVRLRSAESSKFLGKC